MLKASVLCGVAQPFSGFDLSAPDYFPFGDGEGCLSEDVVLSVLSESGRPPVIDTLPSRRVLRETQVSDQLVTPVTPDCFTSDHSYTRCS